MPEEHRIFAHRSPGVLRPLAFHFPERKAVLLYTRYAPANDDLDECFILIPMPIAIASLSFHARAIAVHGLALRKEITLLPIAAEKMPRLGAIDVGEFESAARDGCAGDMVGPKIMLYIVKFVFVLDFDARSISKSIQFPT